MKSSDIATLMAAGVRRPGNGNEDIGWHTGIVESWDDQTGLNTINVNGTSMANLRVLGTGAVTPFTVGDVVGLIRVGKQYFILGKIRAPGAGAGERIASSRIAQEVQAGPQGFGDLPGSSGPSVTMYVGSARRILVVHSCEIAVSEAGAFQAVEVSGASSIAVETGITDAFLEKQDFGTVRSSVTATTLVTAANGLQQGQNTFTCKYKVTVQGNGTGARINNRVLTVIPF